MLSFIKAAVTKCPVVSGSLAVVHIPPELIAELGGLVDKEDDEWALIGKGHTEGLETWIESFWVPAQKRSSGNVDIGSIKFDDKDSGLPSYDVAFIHSHHRLGAFFSGTDVETLNPLRPMSIVVARGTEKLGFAYKAEIRTILPCGDLGIIPVEIQPAVDDWPWPVVPKMAAVEKFTDLGACPNKSSTIHDKYWITFGSSCGLELGDKRPLASAFGKTTNLLTQILATEKQVAHRPPAANLPAAYGGQPTQRPKQRSQRSGGTHGNAGSSKPSSGSSGSPDYQTVPGIWRNSFKCRCGAIFTTEGRCWEDAECLACDYPCHPNASKWLRDDEPDETGRLDQPEQIEARFVQQIGQLERVTDGEPESGDREWPFHCWYHCGEEGCWFDWDDLAEQENDYAECPKCQNPTFPWQQLARDGGDTAFDFGANVPDSTEQSDDAALLALQEHLLNETKVVEKQQRLLTAGFQAPLIVQYD